MATSWDNKSKNASAFSNKQEHQPPAKFDVAQFDKSKFDEETREETRTDWDNKSKNTPAFSNKTKN